MNWKRNLIASLCAAFASAISAYGLTPIVLGIYPLIPDFFSREFLEYVVMSIIVVLPFAFWRGPKVLASFEKQGDLLGFYNLSLKGAFFGIFLGSIAMVILAFYYAGNITED